MSGANFASLLRKSKFAAHDPLITRVYTAPASSRTRGDWGLKYTLPASTTTRPQSRYIRLRSLDAGQGLGCDYVSGEKEARLMETWGDGRYGWNREGQDNGNFFDSIGLSSKSSRGAAPRTVSVTSRSPSVNLESLFEPEEPSAEYADESKLYLPDVEGMSEEHFEKHLNKVRSARAKFAEKLSQRGDRPLYEYRQTGGAHAEEAAPAFLAEEAHQEGASDRGSSAIAPFPHKLFGMAYSEGSQVDSQLHPLMSLPGRVLNGVNRTHAHQDIAVIRAQNATSAVKRDLPSHHEDVAETRVVGVAGLTARMPRARSEALSVMDPTGTDPEEKSTSTFRITSARIDSPPNVVATLPTSRLSSVALNDQSIRHVTPYGRADARFNTKNPLDDMQFELQVAASGQGDKHKLSQNSGYPLLGQKGWVGAEKEHDAIHVYVDRSRARNNGTAHKLTAAGRRLAREQEHERQKDSLADLTKLLSDFGKLDKADKAAGFGGKRGYHTSAVRRNSDKDALPTASIGPGEAAGSEPMVGPGVGGKPDKSGEAGDGLAKGDWRQLEENVAGESRYGENLDEKKD